MQIGDENVHRVRAVMDEVFGDDNCISVIDCGQKTTGAGMQQLDNVADYFLWYSRDRKTNQVSFPCISRRACKTSHTNTNSFRILQAIALKRIGM